MTQTTTTTSAQAHRAAAIAHRGAAERARAVRVVQPATWTTDSDRERLALAECSSRSAAWATGQAGTTDGTSGIGVRDWRTADDAAERAQASARIGAYGQAAVQHERAARAHERMARRAERSEGGQR